MHVGHKAELLCLEIKMIMINIMILGIIKMKLIESNRFIEIRWIIYIRIQARQSEYINISNDKSNVNIIFNAIIERILN